MSRANRFKPRNAQRGVAAIFAAVSLVTLLSAVGLAIDIGRLYYANRDLQRLADLAAIDGARVQSQCLGSAGLEQVSAEVDASLRRNRLPPGVTTLTRLGLRRFGEDGLQFFQPAPPDQAGNSVQVTLSRSSPARILPLFAGEQSRTLTARAAAQSQWGASYGISQPLDAEASGSIKPELQGAVLRASLGLGSTGSSSAANATVSVADFDFDTNDFTDQLPDVDVPTPVLGLLAQLEAALNASGDAAAAQLVSAYAAAVAAGRPGDNVIPAEVLGLPAQGSYDGATTTVGGVLDAITGALSEGEVIELPPLCELLPAVRDLPTAQLLPALCDSTASVSIPQGSRTGSSTSSTQILDVNESSEDSARTGSGLVRVRIRLVNPVNGQPIEVPLVARVGRARVSDVRPVDCQRLGQAMNVVSVTAQGAEAVFAIGDSGSFTAAFGRADVDVTTVLDDVGPVPILSVGIAELLTSAGLGALAVGFPGQSLTVSAYVAPVRVGDSSSETFCMQGPPFNVEERCDGSRSSVGGETAAAIAGRLPEALGDVQLSVQGLPPALASVLQPTVDALTAQLTSNLQGALTLIAPQLLVPVLESAAVSVGESTVRLTSAGARQPQVFAQ